MRHLNCSAQISIYEAKKLVKTIELRDIPDSIIMALQKRNVFEIFVPCFDFKLQCISNLIIILWRILWCGMRKRSPKIRNNFGKNCLVVGCGCQRSNTICGNIKRATKNITPRKRSQNVLITVRFVEIKFNDFSGAFI